MSTTNDTILRRHCKRGFGCVALVWLCLGTAVAQSYIVKDLGTLGGTLSVGVGISNRSWVNGFSNLQRDQKRHAVVWVQGLKIDLGTLGGPNSTSSFPLNERGEVAGGAEPPPTPDPNGEDFCGFGDHLICLPFLWKNGVMTALPTLGGNNGAAFEINNRGQIAGIAENSSLDPTCVLPSLQARPVVWDQGRAVELPTFPGDLDGIAVAINDNAQIVGGSGDCTTAPHALLWQNGTLTDLGNLGGMFNIANDINNQGQVVGISGATAFPVHAFLWQNGVMTDLGTLPGDISSDAGGINEKSQVVGVSQDASFNSRAFLWKNGVMTDLNTLIPANSPFFLLGASSINSQGHITGLALQVSTNEMHAFLAVPVNSGSPHVSPKLGLPENVRRLLQQRLGSRWFGPGSMRS